MFSQNPAIQRKTVPAVAARDFFFFFFGGRRGKVLVCALGVATVIELSRGIDLSLMQFQSEGVKHRLF